MKLPWYVLGGIPCVTVRDPAVRTALAAHYDTIQTETVGPREESTAIRILRTAYAKQSPKPTPRRAEQAGAEPERGPAYPWSKADTEGLTVRFAAMPSGVADEEMRLVALARPTLYLSPHYLPKSSPVPGAGLTPGGVGTLYVYAVLAAGDVLAHDENQETRTTLSNASGSPQAALAAMIETKAQDQCRGYADYGTYTAVPREAPSAPLDVDQTYVDVTGSAVEFHLGLDAPASVVLYADYPCGSIDG